MKDSIWTRERKLIERRASLLHINTTSIHSMCVEADNDDWDAVSRSARYLAHHAEELASVDRELETVGEMTAALERIAKRMEELDMELENAGTD